jgi:hypothetical protein
MIITKLNGGLGNQIFQYSVARHLAILNNTNLFFDIDLLSGESTQNCRSFELEVFNIAGEVLDREKHFSEEISRTGNGQFVQVHEKEVFHFDESILKLRGNINLEGYWQSEKYFSGIRDTLLLEFIIKEQINKKNKKILDLINKCNSVCFHVRRGDYVTNPHTFSNHGLCSLKYYENATSLIVRNVQNPQFFIFSDDPAWCKLNLTFVSPSHVIDINPPNKGYLDLILMTYCKHFIIANSSFSWWGAWLSDNKNKIVIAPKQWFKKENKWNDYTKDLLPNDWIQIDSQR